jgi:hypothetical protein
MLQLYFTVLVVTEFSTLDEQQNNPLLNAKASKSICLIVKTLKLET